MKEEERGSYFSRAWDAFKKQNMTMDTLVSLSIVFVAVWSFYALLVHKQPYFDSLAILLLALFLGHRFEYRKQSNQRLISAFDRRTRFMDRVSLFFAPVIILIASLTLVICGFVLTSAEDAFRRAMTVLLLATPFAIARRTSSTLYHERSWAFFYACVGIPFAVLGFASPAVVDFFLICSSATMFVAALSASTEPAN